MAFDRHATSKIGAVEDIYALHTFGFRGEALASIAAVSQVELRTRQAGDEVGTQTEINGGQFAAQNPVMCPVGSQFFVRNLFYNVPARRRFLDKSTTSASQIKAEFQRIALCNPQIAFELYANDALEAWFTPIYTKKCRPAYILSVLCKPDQQEKLENIIFSNTTTIGIRSREVFRRILKRHQLTVQTPYGRAEVKVCEVPDQEGVLHTRFYPEYETVKRLAKEHNLDLPSLYRLVQNAAENA